MCTKDFGLCSTSPTILYSIIKLFYKISSYKISFTNPKRKPKSPFIIFLSHDPLSPSQSWCYLRAKWNWWIYSCQESPFIFSLSCAPLFDVIKEPNKIDGREIGKMKNKKREVIKVRSEWNLHEIDGSIFAKENQKRWTRGRERENRVSKKRG